MRLVDHKDLWPGLNFMSRICWDALFQEKAKRNAESNQRFSQKDAHTI